MTTLKSSFDQRKHWVSNRASTVFPYFPSVIQSIVFQDYWAWKSNITEKRVVISVWNNVGILVHRQVIHHLSSHNNFHSILSL